MPAPMTAYLTPSGKAMAAVSPNSSVSSTPAIRLGEVSLDAGPCYSGIMRVHKSRTHCKPIFFQYEPMTEPMFDRKPQVDTTTTPNVRTDDLGFGVGRGAAAITARLRRAIETGVYSDGDQLPPERQLATAFGTARSTIRKALHQLESEGLVSRRLGSATFVSYAGPPERPSGDITDLISPLQLIEARMAVEPYMTRLAAIHATRRDLDMMETILARLEEIGRASGRERG